MLLTIVFQCFKKPSTIFSSLCALNLYFINYSQISITQNFKINWKELELSGNQEIGSRKQSTENKGNCVSIHTVYILAKWNYKGVEWKWNIKFLHKSQHFGLQYTVCFDFSCFEKHIESDLEGNKNCFQSVEGLSYQGLALARVKFQLMYDRNTGEIDFGSS